MTSISTSEQKIFIWDKITDCGNKKPTSREGFALVYLNDKEQYLLFAGVSHIRYCDIYTLNRNNWKWNNETCTGELPKELSYCAYWYDAPYFFINGGKNKELGLSDTFFLNTNTWEWKKVFTMDQPAARYHHFAVKIPNKQEVFMFGGFGEKANKCLNDLCKYDYSKKYL